MTDRQAAQPTLRIRVRERGEVSILELHGRLVKTTCAVLRECILQQLAKDKSKLMFGVSNLSYVDSDGLGALVEAVSATKEGTRKLKLLDETGGSNKLKDLLIPGWMGFVEWLEDEEGTLASFDNEDSGRTKVFRW